MRRYNQNDMARMLGDPRFQEMLREEMAEGPMVDPRMQEDMDDPRFQEILLEQMRNTQREREGRGGHRAPPRLPDHAAMGDPPMPQFMADPRFQEILRQEMGNTRPELGGLGGQRRVPQMQNPTMVDPRFREMLRERTAADGPGPRAQPQIPPNMRPQGGRQRQAWRPPPGAQVHGFGDLRGRDPDSDNEGEPVRRRPDPQGGRPQGFGQDPRYGFGERRLGGRGGEGGGQRLPPGEAMAAFLRGAPTGRGRGRPRQATMPRNLYGGYEPRVPEEPQARRRMTMADLRGQQPRGEENRRRPSAGDLLRDRYFIDEEPQDRIGPFIRQEDSSSSESSSGSDDMVILIV